MAQKGHMGSKGAKKGSKMGPNMALFGPFWDPLWEGPGQGPSRIKWDFGPFGSKMAQKGVPEWVPKWAKRVPEWPSGAPPGVPNVDPNSELPGNIGILRSTPPWPGTPWPAWGSILGPLFGTPFEGSREELALKWPFPGKRGPKKGHIWGPQIEAPGVDSGTPDLGVQNDLPDLDPLFDPSGWQGAKYEPKYKQIRRVRPKGGPRMGHFTA